MQVGDGEDAPPSVDAEMVPGRNAVLEAERDERLADIAVLQAGDELHDDGGLEEAVDGGRVQHLEHVFVFRDVKQLVVHGRREEVPQNELYPVHVVPACDGLLLLLDEVLRSPDGSSVAQVSALGVVLVDEQADASVQGVGDVEPNARSY